MKLNLLLAALALSTLPLVAHADLVLTEINSDSTGTNVADFWELTNTGASAVDIGNWKWDDDSRNPSDAGAATIPAGTSIAPGESIVFVVSGGPTASNFRSAWGIPSTVQVIVAGPGFGNNDGVGLFNSSGTEIFFFSYASGQFTQSSGTTSAGGHAGISAGGSTGKSLIIDPTFGLTNRRYTFATAGALGAFASTVSSSNVGSPGVSGFPTVSISDASLAEGNSGTTTLALNVTRSDTTTAFTVDYGVTGGTAIADSDYATLASGTLTFTAGGGATQPINITINGDTTPESAESVLVTISNVVNTTGVTLPGTTVGTGTITDDDSTPPVFTTHPASRTTSSGTSVTLTAVASGLPAPTYQWYEGTSGTTTNPISGATNASYTTPTLTTTTSYWVRATNSMGSADSNTATVTVVPASAPVDLSKYVRVGRYDLPEPTRTTPPTNNLLGQEASGVTYNWDTDTLFIVGDGGSSVTQVTKTGSLVNTMTLPPGGSSQGTEFFDTEGITYIGGGQFVMTEERDRQAVQFTYVSGGTLQRSAAKTVKLGTTIGNVGLEGVTYDPQTNGYIFVKELDPEGIFQTTIDFDAGTASNGSSTSVNSTNLFTPSLASLEDMSDVFAFSNLPGMTGQTQESYLLILSQESGMVRLVDRSGTVYSTMTLVADAGNPLSIQNQTHEGITMDRDGNIYIVSENGGGDADHPQLWVYAPSAAGNSAPTALALSNASTSLPENTSTTSAVKMATLVVTDADGLGVNNLTVSGSDASSFEIIGSGLYLKAGATLSYATKPTYSVTVNVDDTTVGNTPDATANFTLNITEVVSGASAIKITEVAPWSSGDSLVGADWFEVTNTGTTDVDITGWKMTDSNAGGFGSAGSLSGITSIAAGESVIFVDGSDKVTVFRTHWFGSNVPAGLQVGYYGGPGLSTGGDAVTIFDSGGTQRARVDFGASPSAAPRGTFDNSAGLNGTTISQLSTLGENGAFTAVATTDEIGSPGTATVSSNPLVSIVATDADASETGPSAGTFRISRTGSTTSSMDVIYSIATGTGQAVAADYSPTLSSPATIPAGQSFVDITITPVNDTDVEGNETITITLNDAGSYDVGTPATATVTIQDNDSPNQAPTAVTLSNTVQQISESASMVADVRVADISVTDDGLGTNTLSISGADASSFVITGNFLYLKAGTVLNYSTKPAYNVTVNADDTTVGATPDVTATFTLNIAQSPTPGTIVISEVAPWSSSNGTGLSADWFEVTNKGSVTVNLTGWKVDDNSHAVGSAVALNGVTSIAPGQSVIFIESNAPSTAATNFRNLWFGASLPVGVQIGTYTGSGVGLGGTADEVVLFDAVGNIVTGVAFGASPTAAPFTTFDNTAAAGSSSLPFPTLTTFSVAGTNGAFAAAADANEIGSPGNIGAGRLVITEVAPWSSTNGSGLSADWFEVKNIGVAPVNITGWKVDDDSNLFASALALNGITSIAAGETVIFVETSGSQTASGNVTNFKNVWFGGNAPAGLQIGNYSGSGIGLSSNGDSVNLFNSSGVRQASVSFGTSTATAPYKTFDNADALNGTALTQLSEVGVNGAFAAASDANQIGSPGRTTPPVLPSITTQPASQTIATGSSVTLSVVASSPTSPSYQWYRGTAGDTTNPISGATSSSFTTPVLTTATSYWVRVTNTDGSLNSNTAVISVNFATPYSSSNINILTRNDASWNPAGVLVNGTTFVNLGLQGVGRIPAATIDPVTGESVGSISDMQVTNFVRKPDGTFSGTFHFLPDRGYNSGSIYSNYAARLNAYDFTFSPYTSSSDTSDKNQIAMSFKGSTRFTYDHDNNPATAPVFTTGLFANGTATLFGMTVPVALGNATQSDGTVANRLTVDAEGLIFDNRVGKDGTGWIGDEYGAYIYHFNSSKQIDGVVPLPAALIPHSPVGTTNFAGTPLNGRRDNQGMEGIAQSPDGSRLFGLMQSATIQDSGSGNQGRFNTRLLVFDVSSSNTPATPAGQYVIQLPRIDDTGLTTNGNTVNRTGAQSSIIALNNSQLLILSRDGNGRGATGSPVFKSILLADLSAATNLAASYDMEGAAIAPAGTLNAAITPITWSEALNLIGKLDGDAAEVAKFGLNLNTAPGDINTISEKWEALALVSAQDPANPNDYFLFVGNDNDFMTASGKYMDATGTLQSYNAGLENETTVLAYRVRIPGPEIVVEQPSATEVADGSSTNFGDVVLNTPESLTFTVKNTGTASLTLDGFTKDGADASMFNIGAPGATTLAPGASTTFAVQFTPTTEGGKSAVLHIPSNDGDEASYDIALTGKGVKSGATTLALGSATYSVDEDVAGGKLVIPVVRTGDSTKASTVQITTVAGTAANPADYTFTPAVQTVSFTANGPDTINVEIPIINTAGAEPNQSFTVKLQSPTLATLGTPSSAIVTIIDSSSETESPIVPPAVTITTPTADQLVAVDAAGKITITGTATDNSGVKSVSARWVGASDTQVATLATPGSTSTNYSVQLTPPLGGTRTVEVFATDFTDTNSAVVTRTFRVSVPLTVNMNITGGGSVTTGFLGTTSREVGKSYTITATAATTPAPGYVFVGWSLSGRDLASTTPGAIFTDANAARIGTSLTGLAKNTLNFIFREGLILTANFAPNPFGVAVRGTYNGLVRSSPLPIDNTAPSNSSEGFFTATVQGTGAFSGKLTLDGLVLNVAGVFDADGRARFGTSRVSTLTVARPGKPSLIVGFDIGLPGGSAQPAEGKISGSVEARAFQQSVVQSVSWVDADLAYFATTGVDVTPLDDYLTLTGSVPTRSDGVFTVVMPAIDPATQPQRIRDAGLTVADYPKGDGIASLKVSKTGVVSISGTLADGTIITASSTLSSSLEAGLFAPLYGSQGFYGVQIKMDKLQPDSDLKAVVGTEARWARPFMNTSHYYPAGWPEVITTGFKGARYRVVVSPSAESSLRAADGDVIESLTADFGAAGNAELSFAGGLLTEALSKRVSVSALDAVTKVPSNDPTFTLTIQRTAGTFDGSFLHTDDSTCAYKGILFQKGPDARGYGYFLSNKPTVIDYMGESGRVSLTGEAAP